jgi:neutral amino acid transport system ATP-binding protein
MPSEGTLSEPVDGVPLLSLRDVIAGYVKELHVLNGLSLQVRSGEIVTIVGPNGAGKSTVMKAVMGVLRLHEGGIEFRGDDITNVKPHELVGRGISYVPQLNNVFPSLSIIENLEMVCLERDLVTERVQQVFEFFPHLADRRRQPARTMSGGERQMLALGCAIMNSPQLLLLDEPSAALSPAMMESMFAKIVEVNRSGVAILLVEQNARRALEISHRGYVLDMGRNRYEGSGPALLNDPKVAELYLGVAATREPVADDLIGKGNQV